MQNINELINSWKENGEVIVFTNGVFDILHVGHVTYLEQAAALGTKLIVGVNSDASVRALNKGPERPVNPEWARVKVLESLRCVAKAIVFTEDTPLELIRSIEPDVLVKGGEAQALHVCSSGFHMFYGAWEEAYGSIDGFVKEVQR